MPEIDRTSRLDGGLTRDELVSVSVSLHSRCHRAQAMALCVRTSGLEQVEGEGTYLQGCFVIVGAVNDEHG